jgi:ubiquitin-conjugating enzyme E2 variant
MTDWIGWIVLSWLTADFIAGVFHWFEDRYWDADTPYVGALIGGPNKEHHNNPQGLLAGSYWHRNYTTIIPSITACVTCFFVPAWRDAWLAFAFLSQANEVHAWAHSKGKVNKLIEALQETGMVQSARHHGEHHRSPFEIRYCVMSNWLNPILDVIHFWRFCEFALLGVGLRVKH